MQRSAISGKTMMIGPDWAASPPEFNWSDVKGVYKNCRGIWAAQWTDEKGQRHTKYFNPKFYASEATAKYEAYKFKVHIQKEIEMKGGVQKRRSANGLQSGAGGKRKCRKEDPIDVGRRIRRAGVTLGPSPMMDPGMCGNPAAAMYAHHAHHHGHPGHGGGPHPQQSMACAMRYGGYGNVITPDLVALFQSMSPSGLRSEDKNSLQWQPDYYPTMQQHQHQQSGMPGADMYAATGAGCKVRLGPLDEPPPPMMPYYLPPTHRPEAISQACDRLSWSGASSADSSNGDDSTVDTVVSLAPHMWPYEPLWGAPRTQIISSIYPCEEEELIPMD